MNDRFIVREQSRHLRALMLVLCGFGLIVALVLLGIAGNGDYDVAVQEQAVYCEMTASGAWGAYDDSIDCSEAP